MHLCESVGDVANVGQIQCTPYDIYMENLYKGHTQFVWAPIDPSLPYDSDAALEFINSVIGVDYGWEVILTGWIDTIKDNYPCRDREGFPHDQRGICLDPYAVEILFTLMERHYP